MIKQPEQIAREAAERLARIESDGEGANTVIGPLLVSHWSVATTGTADREVAALRWVIADAVLAAIREDRGRPVTPSPIDARRLKRIKEIREDPMPWSKHQADEVVDDLLAHAAHQDAVIADLSRTLAAFGNDADCFRAGVAEGVRRAMEVTQARMGRHRHRQKEHEDAGARGGINKAQADALDGLFTDLEGLIPNETP